MSETGYEFQVGDRVRAKQHAPYIITTDGWEGYVVAEFPRGSIVVWDSEKGSGTPNNGFIVRPEYFELISESAPLAEISDSDILNFLA